MWQILKKAWACVPPPERFAAEALAQSILPLRFGIEETLYLTMWQAIGGDWWELRMNAFNAQYAIYRLEIDVGGVEMVIMIAPIQWAAGLSDCLDEGDCAAPPMCLIRNFHNRPV